MLLADTGVLFGATDRDDPRHSDCADVLDDHASELLVPVPVIVESSWLIESRLGSAAEADFVRAINAGELERVDLTLTPDGRHLGGGDRDRSLRGPTLGVNHPRLGRLAARPPAPEVGHGIDLGL